MRAEYVEYKYIIIRGIILKVINCYDLEYYKIEMISFKYQ